MNPVIGCDPGTIKSGFVVWDGCQVLEKGTVDNKWLLEYLRACPFGYIFAIEGFQSYGPDFPIGADGIETIMWIGRFREAWESKKRPVLLLLRPKIKVFVCHDSKARDSIVRAALIDRYGPVGKKAEPGPLYGVTDHAWSALAVAVMAFSQQSENVEIDNPIP